MHRVSLILIALVFVTAFIRLSAETQPKPRTLTVSANHATSVPGFGFYDFAKSDSAGNMYVHPTEAFAQAAVLRIATSTSEPTLYKLPAEMRDKLNILDFAVTPGGTVWVLADSSDHATTAAFPFNSKGETGARVVFDLPPGVNIYSFLASDREILLLSGNYGQLATKELQGEPYVGLFARSGNLLRTLSRVSDKIDLKEMGSVPLQSGSAVGEDGAFYLLDAKQITVISAGGEISRRIPVPKPEQDLRVAGMYVSGGLAAIRLARLTKDHGVSFNYLVIDLSSKQTIGWYVADPSMGDAAVAFSRTDGFTFYHLEQGMVHLIQAPLR